MSDQSPTTLRRFFDTLVRRSFADLWIRDEPVATYLAELLSRFARAESLYAIRRPDGRRLDTVVDLLIEAQRTWDFQAPDFNPLREREIKRHIGDYTLFMTGIFREYVEGRSITGYYVREGKRAYQFVSQHDRSALKSHALLFAALAGGFESYAGALTYMKKVHLRPELHPAPYQPLLRLLTEW